MSRKIHIIAYIKDELRQLDWLNATDMNGDEAVEYYLQTKEGRFYRKEDVTGYSENRLENIDSLELHKLLKDVAEIAITSEGSFDGTLICFSGTFHGIPENNQPIWELDGASLGSILGKTFLEAGNSHDTDLKILINATGSAVNKTNKPLNVPGDSFIQKVAEAFESGYGGKLLVEGRAGQVMHDNNSLYYGMTFPYDFSLMHGLNSAELKILNGYLKYSYTLEEELSVELINAWLVESMLSSIGLTMSEIEGILKNRENAARKITAVLLENKRICMDPNYMLAPIITVENKQGKGIQVQTSWIHNQEYQTDMHGALGDIDMVTFEKVNIANELNKIGDTVKKLGIQTNIGKVFTDFSDKKYAKAANGIKEIANTLFGQYEYRLAVECDRLHLKMQNFAASPSDSFNFNQGKNFFDHIEKTFPKEHEEMVAGICSALSKLFSVCEKKSETFLKLKNVMGVLDDQKFIGLDNYEHLKKNVRKIVQKLKQSQENDATLMGEKHIITDGTEKSLTREKMIERFANEFERILGNDHYDEYYYVSIGIDLTQRIGHALSCTLHEDHSFTVFDPNYGYIKCINKDAFKEIMDSLLVRYEECDSPRVMEKNVHIRYFGQPLRYDLEKEIETLIYTSYDEIFENLTLKSKISKHDKYLAGSPREETWKIPGQEDISSLEGKPDASNEEKRIVIQMQGDEVSFQAARDLFMKNPRNSNWIQGRDEFGGTVIALEGDQLTAKTGFALEDVNHIKLVLVGHGSELGGQTTLGSLTGQEIGERLSRLFEKKINTGKPESLKISLVGCNLGEKGAKGLPKVVSDHVFEIGRKLDIKPEHIEVTAQKYPVRVNSDGHKEVLTYAGIWVLSEAERLFGDYTKVTYRGTDNSMVEVPHSETKILDIYSKIFQATLGGDLKDYEIDALKTLQADVEKKINEIYDKAVPNMEEVQRVFRDKAAIAKVIEQANKDVIAIKPTGEWILDLQSIKELEGDRVRVDFINKETGERIKNIETESTAIKELKKYTDDTIKYTKWNFNYDEQTGAFSPKPGIETVEVGNEFFNVYFTLSGLLGSARILNSGEFNQLTVAMKVSLVSQLTQTTLGTADLALRAIKWADNLNPASLLEPMSNFSRFVSVIAPIFDIVNITTLAISLAHASPEEQAQIITNLVLGTVGGALSALGLITTVLDIFEFAMEFVALTSEFIGPIGLALAIAAGIVEFIFSIINASKKHKADYQKWQEIDVKYGLFFEYGIGIKELAKGGWDKFIYIDNSSKKLYIKEGNEEGQDLIKFSDYLVITELDFNKRVAVVGDVRLDDMGDNEIHTHGERKNDFSSWHYTPFCPWNEIDAYDSSNWNRKIGGISFYDVFLQGNYTYKIDQKYIDNKNAVYVLPGKAALYLHQCFGFTVYNTGQQHDTEGKEPSFEPYEIEEGKNIEQAVFDSYHYRYRPHVKYTGHNGGSGATQYVYEDYAAIATGLVPEYIPTTIDVKLDGQHRVLAVSPLTVEDAKHLSYQFWGGGSSTVVLLNAAKIKINLNKSKDPKLSENETWLFDLRNQPSPFVTLAEYLWVEQENVDFPPVAVHVNGQVIVCKQPDTKISFQKTFSDDIVSNVLFEVHVVDPFKHNIFLRHIEFNHEYIGECDNTKEQEINRALELIKQVFTIEQSLLFMFNSEIGVITYDGSLLLCLEVKHYDVLETILYVGEIQTVVDSATFNSLYTYLLSVSAYPEMVEYAIQMTSPDLYDLYKSNLEERKYYYYAKGRGHKMEVRGYEIGIDKVKGNPIVIRKGRYKGAKVEVISELHIDNEIMREMNVVGGSTLLLNELYNNPELLYDIVREAQIKTEFDFGIMRINVEDVAGQAGYIEMQMVNHMFHIVHKIIGGSILEYTKHNDDEVIIRYKIVSEQSGTRLLFDAFEVNAEGVPIYEVELHGYLSAAIERLNYGDEYAFMSFVTTISGYLNVATNTSNHISELINNIKDGNEEGWKEIRVLIKATVFKKHDDTADFDIDKEEMYLSFNDTTKEVKLNSLYRNYGRNASDKGYEHMYMKIDGQYGTYTEYAPLDNRDIEIAPGSYSTLNIRRVNSLESKVYLLNDERYRGISVMSDNTSDVEIIIQGGEQFYSTSGFNLFLVRPGGKVAMLPGALKPMDKKIILNVDGRKKIDISEIHKKLRMVEFDSRIVNGTCEIATGEYVLVISEKGERIVLKFVDSIEIDENSDIIWEPKPRVIDLLPIE
ncbi:C80 family cysteine peptidase [Chryseobacterium hispalense]|uniref:C80 family cysteine peptidase n=1 Tax=Chryseobacterium hispalense TaxID=1453492 RepID=UPI00391E02CB